MAEHMFKLSMSSIQTFESNTTESLADVLYEIGKDLLHKQQYSLSIKWLDRAYNVLNDQELDRLSMDASELRTSIMQTLVKALLSLKDQEAIGRARSLVSLLESVLGDKLIVLLLKLEILSAPSADAFDSSQYSDVLQRMTRSLPITEGEEYIERVLITRLWITVSQRESPDALASLQELFTLIVTNTNKPISSAATHGAHTVRG